MRILTNPNSCSRAAALTDATSDVLAESVGGATSVLVAAKQLLEAHQHHRQHQRRNERRTVTVADFPRILRYKLVLILSQNELTQLLLCTVILIRTPLISLILNCEANRGTRASSRKSGCTVIFGSCTGVWYSVEYLKRFYDTT